MLYYTIGQWRIFVWMAAAGALAMGWYDVLRAVRRLLAAGRLCALFCDLAFAAGAALLFFLALYRANYGEARLYTLLAFALGAALYACTLGRLCAYLATKFVQCCRFLAEKARRSPALQRIFR